MQDVSLRLDCGEIGIVHLDRMVSLPLASIASGVMEPESGVVRYRGERWAEKRPSIDATRRGTISRVFQGWGWVSNLSIAENVRLAQYHHTSRSIEDIEDEMQRLALRFGLNEVSGQRPDFVKSPELARSQWVRAFLGKPALIILERPFRNMPDEYHSSLKSAVVEATERGAAVLWMTSDESVHRATDLPIGRRWKAQGNTIMEIDKENR